MHHGENPPVLKDLPLIKIATVGVACHAGLDPASNERDTIMEMTCHKCGHTNEYHMFDYVCKNG